MNNTAVINQVPMGQNISGNSGNLIVIDFDLSKGLTKNTNQDNYGRPIGLSDASKDLLSNVSAIKGKEIPSDTLDVTPVPIPTNTIPEPNPILNSTINQVPVSVVPEKAPDISKTEIIDAVKSLAPTPIVDNKQETPASPNISTTNTAVVSNNAPASLEPAAIPVEPTTILPKVDNPGVVEPITVPVETSALAPLESIQNNNAVVTPVNTVGGVSVPPVSDTIVNSEINTNIPVIEPSPLNLQTNEVVSSPINSVNTDSSVQPEMPIPAGPMPLLDEVIPEPKPLEVSPTIQQNQFDLPTQTEIKEQPKVEIPTPSIIEPVTVPIEEKGENNVSKAITNLDKLKSIGEQIVNLINEYSSLIDETKESISLLSNGKELVEPLNAVSAAVNDGLNKIESLSGTTLNTQPVMTDSIAEQPTNMVM